MRLKTFFPALALLALPALAQGSVQGGFQVGLMNPMGGSSSGNSVSAKDWVDSKIGATVGGHVSWDLNGGHMVRLRLDSSAVSGQPLNGGGSGFDTRINTIGLMGDYVFHVSGKVEGFYLTAGLGFERTRLEAEFGGVTDSESASAMAMAVGLGFRFNRLVGLEFRYITSHPDIAGFTFKNDRGTAGVSFSF